jgi:hypothetical protein
MGFIYLQELSKFQTRVQLDYMSLYSIPVSEQKQRQCYFLTSTVKLLKPYILILVLDCHTLHPFVQVGADAMRKSGWEQREREQKELKDSMENNGLLGYLKQVI